MNPVAAAWHTVTCVCIDCLRADAEYLAPERLGWRRLFVEFTRTA